MRYIDCTIRGERPILCHNPAGMSKNGGGKKQIPTPEEEAEAGCYWSADKSTLVFPAWNVLRCFAIASKSYRVGRRSVAPLLMGAIELQPEMLPFNTDAYEIHRARVTLPGKVSVIRARPMIERGWELSFTMSVSDDVSREAFGMIREILEEGGRRIGIGDFRLEKSGPFGKFAITRWEDEGTPRSGR